MAHENGRTCQGECAAVDREGGRGVEAAELEGGLARERQSRVMRSSEVLKEAEEKASSIARNCADSCADSSSSCRPSVRRPRWRPRPK